MLTPRSGSVWLAAGGAMELASARSSRRIQLQKGAVRGRSLQMQLAGGDANMAVLPV